METIIDYLEELMDFQRTCTIRFAADNGGIASIRAKLSDVYNDNKEGYIKTTDGLTIKISQVVDINGRSFKNIC